MLQRVAANGAPRSRFAVPIVESGVGGSGAGKSSASGDSSAAGGGTSDAAWETTALVPAPRPRARHEPMGWPPKEYREGQWCVGTMTQLRAACPAALNLDDSPSDEPRDVFFVDTNYTDIVTSDRPETSSWRKFRMHAMGHGCWLAVGTRGDWLVLERAQLWPRKGAGGVAGPPAEGTWLLLKPGILDKVAPFVPFSEFWRDAELEARLTLRQHGVDLFDRRLGMGRSLSIFGVGVSHLPHALKCLGCDAVLLGCKFFHRFRAMKRRRLLETLRWLAALAARTHAVGGARSWIDRVFGEDALARVVVGFAVDKDAWQEARARGEL